MRIANESTEVADFTNAELLGVKNLSPIECRDATGTDCAVWAHWFSKTGRE